MSYLILCDSCTDFTKDMEADSHFVRIPLTLHVDDEDIIDDETFDQKSFLKKLQSHQTALNPPAQALKNI